MSFSVLWLTFTDVTKKWRKFPCTIVCSARFLILFSSCIKTASEYCVLIRRKCVDSHELISKNLFPLISNRYFGAQLSHLIRITYINIMLPCIQHLYSNRAVYSISSKFSLCVRFFCTTTNAVVTDVVFAVHGIQWLKIERTFIPSQCSSLIINTNPKCALSFVLLLCVYVCACVAMFCFLLLLLS